VSRSDVERGAAHETSERRGIEGIEGPYSQGRRLRSVFDFGLSASLQRLSILARPSTRSSGLDDGDGAPPIKRYGS
jgi:hypothetical protein